MNGQNYLLKVLSLSTAPRLFSSLYTLISLPIMFRAVGAEEYGKVLYYGAVIAILESFVDFGVSSAAGKELSAARVSRKASIKSEFIAWSKLQLTTGLIGIIPLFVISYIIIKSTGKIEFNLILFTLVVLSAWITICSNFVRASLMALLGFKSLAWIDTYQSLFRSSSFLFVAFVMPTAFGLVLAGFITAITTSLLSVFMIWLLFKKEYSNLSKEEIDPNSTLTQKFMLKESIHFLWLRLNVRSFDSIPIFLFGRFLGAEIVGILGAVAKLLELISFPFAVIGNALSVQSKGILIQGMEAVKALWDTIFRIIGLSIFGVSLIILGNEYFASILLPKSNLAPLLIAILSFQVLFNSISTIVGPVSDYIGALRNRNILLTTITLIQIPVLWIASLYGGNIGGIAAFMGVLMVMNAGYLRIAINIFFKEEKFFMRREVIYFGILVVISLLMSIGFQSGYIHYAEINSHSLIAYLLPAGLFISMVFTGVLLIKPLRLYYFNKQFLDFQANY